MFKNFTKIHWIFIGVLLFCILIQTKEYFDIPSTGLTSTIEDNIKSHVFGNVRPKVKFQNFVYQTNKICDSLNVTGKDSCVANEYCQYTDKCIVKSDTDVLIELNNKINQDNTFSLDGY